MIAIKQNLIIIFNLIKGFFTIDNVGAFVLPIELRLQDQEFLKYIHLDVDWDVDSISAEDLPDEFSSHAVKLIDLFRRKTANLPYECMLYFDYKTGQIIYCFIGDNERGRVRGEIYEEHFEGMNVASIHNHPEGFLSPPSGTNFQILEIKNEKYELICGYDEFWILEAEGTFDSKVVDDIRKNTSYFYFNSFKYENQVNKTYGEFLVRYINDEVKDNIKLIRVRYR
ncbi:hypothetical protein [Methanobrevibacter millerae]|uniref:Uncharacterized protein n=1 Tax=Methanobrevibacter millerae TaxID=230361 RepID=A0A1G5XPH6_9EURY|nr:hypothetical protein [Methanobrevibacter millerae]SDA71856.1 hypothetical protein SAMN02910315_02381 [Methanobrevibacter millerae]